MVLAEPDIPMVNISGFFEVLGEIEYTPADFGISEEEMESLPPTPEPEVETFEELFYTETE